MSIWVCCTLQQKLQGTEMFKTLRSIHCVLSCSAVSYSLRPHGLWPARLLCPWDFPDKNTRVGYHFSLQGIFLTQESNPGLLHWEVDSLPLHHLERKVGLCFLQCFLELTSDNVKIHKFNDSILTEVSLFRQFSES